MKRNSSSSVVTAIKLAIGILLIGLLIFRNDNATRIVNLVAGLRIDFLLYVCIAALLTRLVSAYKWQILLAAQGAKISLYRLFRYTLIGQFFSNFLPGMIGGDITKIYFLNQQVKSATRAVGSVFLDRFSGLVALLLLTLCFSAANFKLMSLPAVGIAVAATFVLSIGLVVALAMGDRFFALAKPARSIRMVGRLLDMFEKLHEEIMSYRTHKIVLLKALVYSAVFYLLASVCLYLSGLTIGVNITFIDIALVTPIIYLVATIPVTPSNVGWWEWIVTLFLGELGASTAESVTVALIMRVVITALSLLGGIYFLTEKGSTRLVTNETPHSHEEQSG